MLSWTTKLGCPSWSLQAIDTCPGAFEQGKIVEVCEACYARGGNYRFPNVKAKRVFNQKDWTFPDWENRMAAAIEPYDRFRWLDSGDSYSKRLWEKMYTVVKSTPKTKHWIPTRMLKFKAFRPYILKVRSLPNVVVRQSSDHFDEVLDYEQFGHSSVVLSKPNAEVFSCPAYDNGGKCGSCRACWDPDIPVIGYAGHGRKFFKLIEVKNA